MTVGGERREGGGGGVWRRPVMGGGGWLRLGLVCVFVSKAVVCLFVCLFI